MRCRDFEEHLESWFGENLESSLQLECSAHAVSCPYCAELVVLMEVSTGRTKSGPSAARSPRTADSMPAGFLTEVLKATSGAPCDKIEKWLVDEAWGTGTTRHWVREHLEDCSPCRSLEATLVELRRELPRLASLPVETGFTERVLRKTLPPRQRFARWSTSLWRRWLVRPRFASELAYVLTVVLIVLVGSPSAPLRALSETRDGRVTVEHLERDLQTAASTLGARVPKAELTAVWSFVEGTTRLVGESLDEGVEAVRGGWAGGLAFGKSLLRAIVDGDESPSG